MVLSGGAILQETERAGAFNYPLNWSSNISNFLHCLHLTGHTVPKLTRNWDSAAHTPLNSSLSISYFLMAVVKYLTRTVKGRRVYFGSQFKDLSIMTWKAWGLECEAAAFMVSSQEAEIHGCD